VYCFSRLEGYGTALSQGTMFSNETYVEAVTEKIVAEEMLNSYED